MKRITLSLIAVLALMACSQPQNTADQSSNIDSTKNAANTDENKTINIFGDSITINGAISVAELQTMMEGKDSVSAKVQAVATDVCAKKGCWMKVALNDSTDMRITFKDYGFFVPKDISGKKVVFEGMAKRKVTSVEDLKHFAKDGGESEEAIAKITEPKKEITFEASGVVVM